MAQTPAPAPASAPVVVIVPITAAQAVERGLDRWGDIPVTMTPSTLPEELWPILAGVMKGESADGGSNYSQYVGRLEAATATEEGVLAALQARLEFRAGLAQKKAEKAAAEEAAILRLTAADLVGASRNGRRDRPDGPWYYPFEVSARAASYSDGRPSAEACAKHPYYLALVSEATVIAAERTEAARLAAEAALEAEKAAAAAKEAAAAAKQQAIEDAEEAWLDAHLVEAERLRSRWEAGLLPDKEFLAAVREVAFTAAQSLAPYQRITASEVQSECGNWVHHDNGVDFEATDATEATEEEFAALQRLKALFPDATVTLQDHKGSWDCGDDDHPLHVVRRKSVRVEMTVDGQWDVHRHFAA